MPVVPRFGSSMSDADDFVMCPDHATKHDTRRKCATCAYSSGELEEITAEKRTHQLSSKQQKAAGRRFRKDCRASWGDAFYIYGLCLLAAAQWIVVMPFAAATYLGGK